MESLAYLYLAQDYENPEDKPIALLKNSARLAVLEHVQPPNVAALGIAGMLCCPGIVGLSQAAQAQTYSSEGLYPYSVYANDDSYAYGQPDSVGNSSAVYPCSNSYYPGSSDYLPVRPKPVTPARFSSLTLGDSSSAVGQLQDLLRNAGYFNSPSTGYFGTITESAVIAFQQDYGLVVDGVAGSQTIAALQGSNYRPVRPSSIELQAG
jgi:Putative peptidoglycan binding domain